MAYLIDIFNVFHLEVTVTSNDILRIEIKRSSTSVRVGCTYECSHHQNKADCRFAVEVSKKAGPFPTLP
jgi:hypothetical protein